jgi:hypothetical protein
MVKLIRGIETNSKGTTLAIYDKTHKQTEFNYLVNVENNGVNTEFSKLFETLEEAEAYFLEIKSKSDFTEEQKDIF